MKPVARDRGLGSFDACRSRARGGTVEPHGHAEGLAGLARHARCCGAPAASWRAAPAARSSSCGHRAKSFRSCPTAVRVVEDAHEGRGPDAGHSRGPRGGRTARSRSWPSTDMPFLHPRFVAAVCAAAATPYAAVPHLGGFRQPLAAAYRTALAPLVADLVGEGRMKPAFLFERCDTRWLADLPHPESVRNLNELDDYEAALGEPQPASACAASDRCAVRPPRCARRRSGAAAAAVGVRSTRTSWPRSTATRSHATRRSRSPRVTRWRSWPQTPGG